MNNVDRHAMAGSGQSRTDIVSEAFLMRERNGFSLSWFPFHVMSRLVRNVLPFDSLEMTSVDLIQAMLDWCVEIGCCIFSRDDPEGGRVSSSVQGFVVFDDELRASEVTP